MSTAFQYAIENEIELGSDYPYTGKDDTCAYDGKKGKA